MNNQWENVPATWEGALFAMGDNDRCAETEFMATEDIIVGVMLDSRQGDPSTKTHSGVMPKGFTWNKGSKDAHLTFGGE